MDMTQVVPAEMTRYFKHPAAGSRSTCACGAKEKVFIRPFSYGNSIGHLILHLTET